MRPSWIGCVTEGALRELAAKARMAKHDALPSDLRRLSSEEGLPIALEAQTQRNSDALLEDWLHG